MRETMAKEVIEDFLKAMKKLGIDRQETIAFLEKEEDTCVFSNAEA